MFILQDLTLSFLFIFILFTYYFFGDFYKNLDF
nr:MAG TPA: cytochrome oxidase subunit [Bacteriophage sp.]